MATETKTDNGLSRAATMDDVARIAGVTKMTVSYVFTGKKRISDATRENVLSAARELNFEPNPHAQRLSSGRAHNVVGLFSLLLDLGVGTRTLQLLQRALHDEKYFAPIHGYGFAVADEVDEQVALISELRRQKPRAIVCATVKMSREALEELQRYQNEGGVVICFNYGAPVAGVECDQVTFDTENAIYQAARHLCELGHERIGLFENGPYLPAGKRKSGFERALREAKREVRATWQFCGGEIGDHEAGGVSMARQFLSLPPEARPTGLCLINDYSAQAFVSEIVNHGLRVPADVSVVGHDDMAPARHSKVPLSTVTHPVEAIVSSVMELLSERLENNFHAAPRQKTLRGQLIQRASSAPPPAL